MTASNVEVASLVRLLDHVLEERSSDFGPVTGTPLFATCPRSNQEIGMRFLPRRGAPSANW